MKPERLDRARDFVIRNARLLERQLFAFHFDKGPAAPVLHALAAYQNPDGGFGNALEPDKRDPGSQPQDVEIAFETMDSVGTFDLVMAGRACAWLVRKTTVDGGIPFALPSLNDFPHAPWWHVAEEVPRANLNPTAAILGFVLKHKFEHLWTRRALEFCWREIEASESREFHDVMPMICFLQHAPERAHAEAQLARIAERISAPGAVEMDPAAGGYVKKPLDWAPGPDSFLAKLFTREVLDRHLEALASRQQEDGGWPISWPTVSPGVTLEWRGRVTIQALRTLEAYLSPQ